MAKLAAILKSIRGALSENVSRSGDPRDVQLPQSFEEDDVETYFQQVRAHILTLQVAAPELYGDFEFNLPDPQMAPGAVRYYKRKQVERLARDIEQIFEIRANSQHAPTDTLQSPRRIFLTHGRALDWLVVQAHLEKDLRIETLELAQEASQSLTIIEKLEANSKRCDSAVIVMSGDDSDAEGGLRARENVVHEIGYFQSAYGRRNVILLHEDGVSIPSNLSGIVYAPYPKGKVDAAFGVLDRELKAIYMI